MSFLEESWEEREEKSYKDIFGDTGPGIYPLSTEIFDHMNAKSIDPRWLTHGVFKCPPNEKRVTWAYVTSGMSNPWETENEETWAIEVLQTLMAYNFLFVTWQVGDFPPLDHGHRLTLALPESIKTMMFIKPINFPDSFSIKSGQVNLIQVVGITPSELEVAKQTSSEELKEVIIKETGGLLTRKERPSIV